MVISSSTIVKDEKYLDLFCDYLYKNFGIITDGNKKNLLFQKLAGLMVDADIHTMGEFYHAIVAPPISEKQRGIQNKFVDTITVHKTNFFREINHFKHIKDNIEQIVANSPSCRITKELRIWSSACSTGEEPYTLAMVLNECLPKGITPKILASDVSGPCLQKAMGGIYKLAAEDEIPPQYMKYFISTGDGKHKISDDVKKFVTFRLFNLMSPFPFKNPFDIILCKNVMIYFDRDIQEQLINKFYDCTCDKGMLYIGHSESLIQLKHNYEYVKPTIYQKNLSKKG